MKNIFLSLVGLIYLTSCTSGKTNSYLKLGISSETGVKYTKIDCIWKEWVFENDKGETIEVLHKKFKLSHPLIAKAIEERKRYVGSLSMEDLKIFIKIDSRMKNKLGCFDQPRPIEWYNFKLFDGTPPSKWFEELYPD